MSWNDPTRKIAEAAVVRYALACSIAVFAIALRYWMTPLLGEDNPYHTAWVAVVFSAWYCGLGPSIAATLMTLFGVWYWLLTPPASLQSLDRRGLWGMFGFLALSALVVALGEANRRSKVELERSESALRESASSLEHALDDRALEIARQTKQLSEQAKLIDLVNDAIFVRKHDDTISYWNRGAEKLYGWTAAEAIGKSPQQLFRTVFPVPFSEITQSEHWEGELVQAKRDGSKITVASRWTTLRNDVGQPAGWLEINTNITARKQAEDAARRLSGRILNLQDEERRRIARELHDSLGQYLTAAKMNLDLLSMNLRQSEEAGLVNECIETVNQCLSETRTLSHLLHPPLLDEAGLLSAARWYAEGFAQRSGLEVNLDFPADLVRLPRNIETVLFRGLQEALTNVHRHSGGTMVRVTLQADAESIRMEVKDNGSGIPQERVQRFIRDGVGSGVGLAGLRERVREVSGVLTLLSGSGGTTVVLAIPLLSEAPSSSHDQAPPAVSVA